MNYFDKSNKDLAKSLDFYYFTNKIYISKACINKSNMDDCIKYLVGNVSNRLNYISNIYNQNYIGTEVSLEKLRKQGYYDEMYFTYNIKDIDDVKMERKGSNK